MPFTPFVGLSIFIHIFLIFVFKTVLFLLQKTRAMLKILLASSWFGWFIIFFVSSFVLASASLLVSAGIMEEHSTISYFRHYEFSKFAPLEKTRADAYSWCELISKQLYKFYYPKLIETME